MMMMMMMMMRRCSKQRYAVGSKRGVGGGIVSVFSKPVNRFQKIKIIMHC